MGKGGDSTVSATTNSLATFAEPYYQDLIKKSQTEAMKGYSPYTGQRLANFSGDTTNSFDMIRDQVAQGTGGLPAAQAAAAGVAGFQPGAITTGGITDADLSGYMNPYIDNVVDNTAKKAQQRFREQQILRDDAAIKAGAFGGDRRFVADSLARRDLNEQLDTINAEGYSSAFDRATGLFTSDAERGLQAGIANEEARRLAGSLSLDAANASADMAQQWQDMGLRNAEALSTVGAKVQQREQAGLDLAAGDFARQQADRREKLSWYAALLNGAPITPNSSTTQAESPPDFLSQLLGLGIAGFGGLNMMS